jgi:hypothetical protein
MSTGISMVGRPFLTYQSRSNKRGTASRWNSALCWIFSCWCKRLAGLLQCLHMSDLPMRPPRPCNACPVTLMCSLTLAVLLNPRRHLGQTFCGPLRLIISMKLKMVAWQSLMVALRCIMSLSFFSSAISRCRIRSPRAVSISFTQWLTWRWLEWGIWWRHFTAALF